MRCVVRTVLDAPADSVWEAVVRPATLELVTRGLLGFTDVSFPERWRTGVSVAPRLVFLHVIPAWKHHLTVIVVDDAARVLETREGGGPIQVWNHRISVEPRDSTSCVYTDTIDLSAGLLTPLVRVYAELFYRYRQRRWHHLVETFDREVAQEAKGSGERSR